MNSIFFQILCSLARIDSSNIISASNWALTTILNALRFLATSIILLSSNRHYLSSIHYSRKLIGSTNDPLNPAFRIIYFDDDSAILTVSAFLVCAWPAILPSEQYETSPSGSNDFNDFGPFAQAFARAYQDNPEAIPQDPDTDTVHTPWHDIIYH